MSGSTLPTPAPVEASAAAAPGRRQMSRRALAGTGGGLAALAGAVGLGAAWLERPAAGRDARGETAHLLRRAGFAPSAAEVDAAVKAGPARTLDILLHPERVDDSALERRLAADNFDLGRVADLRRWWLVRMAFTRRPLVEKMTLFWHGLLTTSYRKVGKDQQLLATQNQFLRDHALGNLRDLLVGISKDGAMLHWLDGTGSTRAHPNENYARELMELFTMGVGNYSETDVRELARALTGWTVDTSGMVQFRPRAHDTGSKTLLGRTGNLGLEEAVDIILGQPATAVHLATRMWEYFVYPGPSHADLAPVVDAYHRSHYDARAMMAAVLGAPAFSTARAYRALVKSPVELAAGVSRQLNLVLPPAAFTAMEAMGQALYDPPNVAGWPSGAGWLSTGTWMARVRWLLAVGADVKAAAIGDLDRAAALMVDGNLSSGARAAIHDHLGGGHGSDLFFLVGASPEYQLA